MKGFASSKQILIISCFSVVCLITTVLYISTLMTSISGCAHEYCVDAGEFQVALPLWGTVHHTGYPLYMLLGSPFVTFLHLLGIPPSTGASLYSTVWAVLAVGFLMLLIYRITKNIWLSSALGLLFTTIEPVWIHGVIPEVYSLSNLLFIGIFWLTLDLHEIWSDKKGWLLAFISGIGIAHHRLLALALLPISLFLLPKAVHDWRERKSLAVIRWMVGALLLFFSGFLPYLDIPLRIRLGTSWLYHRADTWEGLWYIFMAQEVSWLMKPETTWTHLYSAFRSVIGTLISDLTLPGFILVGLSTLRSIWFPKTRTTALLAVLVGATYIVFATAFSKTVFLQATLLNVLIISCLLLGIGLGSFRPFGSIIGTALCLCCALWLGAKNFPFVTSLTRDPTSIHYVATVEQAEAPPGAVIMAPWGMNYFALAYAQRIEGRMTQWRIVDHRANYRELTGSPSRVYTHSSTLYVFGPEWWAEKLGKPLRITSVGPEMVMLTAEPLENLQTSGIPIGNGIVIDGWEIRAPETNVLHIVVYWGAWTPPSRDYSTFVYLTDKDEILYPEDLIAQADFVAPVYGWYPTSQWVIRERIREDRVFRLSHERLPNTIMIGMYWRTPDGNFHLLDRAKLRKDGQQWVLAP